MESGNIHRAKEILRSSFGKVASRSGATVTSWQINWGRSDASPAVKQTLTITTLKRVK